MVQALRSVRSRKQLARMRKEAEDPLMLAGKTVKVAVLDDYQSVALEMADWSVLREKADVAVFRDPLSEPTQIIARLQPFEVVWVMRERTPLPRSILEQLPNLKLICSRSSLGART